MVNTIHHENKKNLLDSTKAQTILMQAMKGAGKSNTLEWAGQQLFDRGWTGLDIWAAPNGENWFYPINFNHRTEYLEMVAKDPAKKGVIHCNCNRTYPIMIICPDTKKFDQYSIDLFNDTIIRSKEWWIHYCIRNNIFPVEFRKEMIGKKIEVSKQPLITVKYLPEPTQNGSNHEMFRMMMIDSVLQCRKEGRYLTFNPMIWDKEFPRFKAIDLTVRLLEYMKYTYFMPQTDDVLEPIRQKIRMGRKLNINELRLYNWDKMFVIAREFGELTASNLRAETNSTITKRAFLMFIRRSRHAQITLLGDYQNPDDVFPSIRDQADIFLLKRAPRRLFGQGWNWLFEKIERERQAIFNKHGLTRYSNDLANRLYPRIEQLANNYLYAVYPDDSFVLWKIPSPDFHHKKAEEHFRVITGIMWEDIGGKSAKTIEMDSMEGQPKELKSAASIGLMDLIKSLVGPKESGGKGLEYKDAFDKIMKMAEEGKIPRPSWSNWNSMYRWYKRNNRKQNF